MIMKFIKLLLLTSLMTTSVFAQNAKVIEVQEKIKDDISRFLEKFSPNTKYSVRVKIKPLRRKYDYGSRAEDLPFMEFQEDLVIDEWDDPKVSIYSLYGRIAEARVSIFIEDKVKIENRSKFKEALLRDVNLVPGRDSVSIEAISTPVLEKAFNWKEQTEIILLGIMLIIAVVLGVGLNSLAKRLVPQQVINTGGSSESSKPQTSVATPAASPIAQSSTGRGHLSELKGDLNIQDPSKINEVVGKKILKLVESDMFPTLSDMVIFEELLDKDPSSFSYLVYEFPLDIQRSIYQLGKGENWFKGFSEVGFPSKVVMIALDKMIRSREVKHSEKFESLLTHAWRLGKELPAFITTLTKEEAFSILFYLPKDISIPVARECYPGSWGSILEDKPQSIIRNEDVIQKLITQTLSIQPYFNYDSLQVFKNRKDLLKYLDTVEPQEEKDIYSVMGDQNNLSTIRPPFFKFFELNKEERLEVYQKFSMNEWAVACFNIDRAEKDLVTDLMDDKEKYLFSHTLQQLDQNIQLTENKNIIRHSIAKFVFENYGKVEVTKPQEVEQIVENSEDDLNVA